jgi:hypothetical protein
METSTIIRKLFDSNMTQNYFNTFKSSLNPNHKFCIISCMGKMRIGKSTLLNIIISQLKAYSGKKIFFKEEDNPTSVTSGADYFILSDSSNKTDYVFIDCEGSGNYNSADMIKLYLLISAISNVLIFNVEKAADDQTFNSFLQQILTHLEFLNIPIPTIYLIFRDTGKKALINYLNEELSDINELQRKAANSIHSKFSFKSHIKTNNIHFLSTPPSDDEGRVTSDPNSAFYQDVINFFNELSKNFNFINSLTEQEKRINFLWTYNISQLNHGGYQNFLTTQIQKLIDDNYSKIFFNPQNQATFQKCINTYREKYSQYEQLITKEVKQIFIKLDPNLNNLIKELLQKKISHIETDINSKYQTQKNNYLSQRENTIRNDPIYGNDNYSEAYTEYEYQHKGYVETYCTSCNQLYSSIGHRQTGAHTGGRQTHKKRFLGVKIRSWETWTCCGQESYGSFCPYSPRVHDGSARLFTECRHSEGTAGCTAIPRTAYRNATRSVIKGYNKVYTLPDWNENMFTYLI